MQSKKKFKTLLPIAKKKCCFLKFIDFEPIVKYGSIFIILGNDTKDKKKINENPSSIQERRDALKKMFN